MSDAEQNNQDEAPEPERREFLTRASRVAMGAGLVAGYGTFGAIATRYLYPARPSTGSWQFLVEVGRMAVGESLRYRAPAGETVSVMRQAANGDADDFIALSSTCPHLGCQVHWEQQNQRFFCPCHNGVFDPSGVGVSGPPGDAGQSLPRYPLRVEGDLVYIRVSTARLVDGGDGRMLEVEPCRSAAGHDPCLAPRADKRGRA